jgi:hypothetical protein
MDGVERPHDVGMYGIMFILVKDVFAMIFVKEEKDQTKYFFASEFGSTGNPSKAKDISKVDGVSGT